MDAQPDDEPKIPQAEAPVAAADGVAVSEAEFEEVVRGALGAVGGRMLFKLSVGSGVDCEHIAAGVIGEGDRRQFLVLSLPVAGGKLRVEPATRSRKPVAGIAAAYAGLVDLIDVAA